MLLRRYEAGEFYAVWQEIGSIPNLEGHLRDEVLSIAKAAMHRVARNADLLADRLSAAGWKPLSPDLAELRTRPSAEDEVVFAQIAKTSGGPVPPTLLAFWKVVGGINFVWDYEGGESVPDLGVDLPMDEMDPLCVDSARGITDLFEEWEEQKGHSDTFRIDLAPDHWHKANVSGGSPYAVLVPFLGADPIFTDERHALPFLDYLRLAFKWAGFPGLEDHAERGDVQRFVAKFGLGLEPF